MIRDEEPLVCRYERESVYDCRSGYKPVGRILVRKLNPSALCGNFMV